MNSEERLTILIGPHTIGPSYLDYANINLSRVRRAFGIGRSALTAEGYYALCRAYRMEHVATLYGGRTVTYRN